MMQTAIYRLVCISFFLSLPVYLAYRCAYTVNWHKPYQVVFLAAEAISCLSVICYALIRIRRPWSRNVRSVLLRTPTIPPDVIERINGSFDTVEEVIASCKSQREQLAVTANWNPLGCACHVHKNHRVCGQLEDPASSLELGHGQDPLFSLQSAEALQYRVRVLIPCYNEPLSVIAQTVLAALDMDYPRHLLFVYLCDDGADPLKREFVQGLLQVRPQLQGHLVYEARVKPKGQPHHGKAGNLNNVLRKVIYADHVSNLLAPSSSHFGVSCDSQTTFAHCTG